MRLCALNTHLCLSLLAFTVGFDPVAAAQSLQARQQSGNGNNSNSISENCQNGACTTTICTNSVCTVCTNGSCTTSTQGQASPTKANTGTLTSTPAATGTGKSKKKSSSTDGFTLTFTGTANPSATRESTSKPGSTRKGLSIGAIVGIAVAGTVVLGLMMMCLLSRRASARQKRRRPRGTMLIPSATSSTPSIATPTTPTTKVSESEEMGESTMNQSLLVAAARPAALRTSHQSWASAPPQSPYTPHNLRAGYPPENIYTNEMTQSPARAPTRAQTSHGTGGRNYHSVYDLVPDYRNLPSPHEWTAYNSTPVQGTFGADGLASMPSRSNRRPGSAPTYQRGFVGSHSTPTHAELVNYQQALEHDGENYGAGMPRQPFAMQDSPTIYYSQH